ncbi:MAG: DUF1778 domain-containing protein [Methylococcaceae bacterium]|nr:DUF1778 domain-containing protein [Methylococcaceae bacterium]
MQQTTTQNHNIRNITINIRAKEQQRDLIDRAAQLLGKNRSDFMLETVCKQAESVLLEQCYFTLAEDNFEKFNQLLDQPPKENSALKKLLNSKSPWE